MKTNALAPRTPRDLLARILDTPELANVVKSLEPKVLYQLVRHCGLEDCGEIVALASSEQLPRLFDADLWRSEGLGQDERLDDERFGLWLQLLAEIGAEEAARRLVEMDFDFVSAAINGHVLVVDERTSWLFPGFLDANVVFDLGGRHLIPRHAQSWDALLEILIALEHDHPAFFERLMRRSAHFATEYIPDNGGLYEVLSAAEQAIDDAAGDRERRRDREGYVSPSEAAAFLELSRQPTPPRGDAVSARYVRELVPEERVPVSAPAPDVSAFLSALQEAGVLEAPLPLLPPAEGAAALRLARIRDYLLAAEQQGEAAAARCTQELAYLANVLVARQFREREATEAALATCNLGLLDSSAPSASLVSAFQSGFRLLHRDVSVFVAERLLTAVSGLRCGDRELRRELASMARTVIAQLGAGTPWKARAALDPIAVLDPSAWTILAGLLAELPVLPKGVTAERRPLRISPEPEFLSETSQIAWVHDFVETLPERLSER